MRFILQLLLVRVSAELETLISPYSSVVSNYWRSEEVKLVLEKISKVN